MPDSPKSAPSKSKNKTKSHIRHSTHNSFSKVEQFQQNSYYMKSMQLKTQLSNAPPTAQNFPEHQQDQPLLDNNDQQQYLTSANFVLPVINNQTIDHHTVTTFTGYKNAPPIVDHKEQGAPIKIEKILSKRRVGSIDYNADKYSDFLRESNPNFNQSMIQDYDDQKNGIPQQQQQYHSQQMRNTQQISRNSLYLFSQIDSSKYPQTFKLRKQESHQIPNPSHFKPLQIGKKQSSLNQSLNPASHLLSKQQPLLKSSIKLSPSPTNKRIAVFEKERLLDVSFKNNIKDKDNLPVQVKNYQSLSNQQLIKIIEQQTSELKSQKEQIKQHEEKIAKLKGQKREFKNINKELFREICSDTQFSYDDGAGQGVLGSPSKIHQIYQDFFITDMKKEIEKATNMMSEHKSAANNAMLQISQLKRDNINLKALMRRYKKMANSAAKNSVSQDLDSQRKNEKDIKHMTSYQNFTDTIDRNNNQPTEYYGDDYDEEMSPMTKISSGRMSQKKLQGLAHLRRSSVGSVTAMSLNSKSKSQMNVNNIVQEALEQANQDRQKIAYFYKALKTLMECSTMHQMIECLIMNIKRLVGCTKCAFIFFDADQLLKLENIPNSLYQVKFGVEGMNVAEICMSEKEMMQPAFQKFVDILNSAEIFKRKDFVCSIMPQYLADEDTKKPLGCIQMEFNRPSSSSVLVQLSQVEEFILKTFSQMTSLKLSNILCRFQAEKRKNDIIDIMKISGELLSQKTYSTLINQFKKTLSKFFGFNNAGVLLKNEGSTELFTNVNDQPDSVIDRKEDFVSFPSTVGLTGYVVKNREIIYCNNIQKDMRFNSSTDNVPAVNEPYNIMICPIIDKDNIFNTLKREEKKEINSKLSIKKVVDTQPESTLLGVIQFINKSDKSQIDEYDMLKFEQINQLLVIAIRSVKDMRVFLNLTLAHSNSLANQNEKFEQVRNLIDNEQHMLMSDISDTVYAMRRFIRTKMDKQANNRELVMLNTAAHNNNDNNNNK